MQPRSGAVGNEPLPHSPPRPAHVHISSNEHELAPVGGMEALRRVVANRYNARYRVAKTSQYGTENVCLCSGGRSSLTHVMA